MGLFEKKYVAQMTNAYITFVHTPLDCDHIEVEDRRSWEDNVKVEAACGTEYMCEK